MAFSDEEILEEVAFLTRLPEKARVEAEKEMGWGSGFRFRDVKKLRKRKHLTEAERKTYRVHWYLQKRDTPKYKRNKVKSQLAYAARNSERIAKARQRRSTEAQLLKYLQLYLTFNPDEAKRAHVVALLQLFQPHVD
jgi:hypothetical protein